MENDRMDELRDTARGEHHAVSTGPANNWGPIDEAWDKAVAAARTGDFRDMVRYVADRSGFPLPLVDSMLTGTDEEAAALMCRAAALPWESFEGILTARARRFARGPGMVGAAVRLFRDTPVEIARGIVRLAADGVGA
jgi:hypothetical protein